MELNPGASGPCIAGIHAPLVQLADGRLMAMGRLDNVADQERFGFKMPVSYSSDLGETWTYEASEFPVVSNTQRPCCCVSKKAPSCSAPSPIRPANSKRTSPPKA